jgi:hypothetical protein
MPEGVKDPLLGEYFHQTQETIFDRLRETGRQDSERVLVDQGFVWDVSNRTMQWDRRA